MWRQRVAWALTLALLGTGALAFVTGELWAVLLLALLGMAAPLLIPLLAVGFDAWAAARVGRLLGVAFGLALAASVLLLLLPVRSEGLRATASAVVGDGRAPETTQTVERVQRVYWPGLIATQGVEIAVKLALPVAVAGAPLVVHLATRRWRTAGRIATGTASAVAALLLLVGVYLGSMSLIGIFYVPAAGAMLAAAVRVWRASQPVAVEGH